MKTWLFLSAMREKGHFPNPTADFKVFKLLDANFPGPR